MRIILISILLASPGRLAVAEPDARCRESEALSLQSSKTSVHSAGDVEIFAATLGKEGCDDGVYAEQATEVVCSALANDFAGVIKLGDSAEKARAFILRHINPMAAEADLVQITRKRGYCFVANSRLCQDVIASAEKSLQSMYKKGRSFDRKPNAVQSK